MKKVMLYITIFLISIFQALAFYTDSEIQNYTNFGIMGILIIFLIAFIITYLKNKAK